MIEKLKKCKSLCDSATNQTLTELKLLSEKIVFKWQNICNFEDRERLV